MDGRCRRLIDHLMHDALLCVGEILLWIKLTTSHRIFASKNCHHLELLRQRPFQERSCYQRQRPFKNIFASNSPHQKRIFLSSNYC
jgi:hypothetical protein